MIPTIYYESDGYSINHSEIMGRQAAGNSFLKGLFKHYEGTEIWFYGDPPEKPLLEALKSKKTKVLSRENFATLEKSGLYYYPSPDISTAAYLRSSHSETAWSICGITHTTSSSRVMDALTSIVTAPTRPWDAVICTSSAVKTHCNTIISQQIEYLKKELGIKKISLPKFPVIPLGINTMEFISDGIDKTALRKKYGIQKDEIAVLYLGRLSFHAKAHPFQQYRALNELANELNKKLCMIEFGWYANSYIEEAFTECFAAEATSKNFRRIVFDGTDQQQKKDLLSLSDLFVSLSDNIQETFGITPLEAMSAGLPVVVSDWDGYKETVTDAVGMKIPTVFPPAGLGTDIIEAYASNADSYDVYLGKVSALVSVDQKVLTESLRALITNESMRLKMGQAAQRWVRDNFDWSKIIPRYIELWLELKSERNNSATPAAKITWPARLDPMTAFQHYSSKKLNQVSKVVCSFKASQRPDTEVDRILKQRIFSYNNDFYASRGDLVELLGTIKKP